MSLMTERTRDSEEKKENEVLLIFVVVDFLGRNTQQMRLGLTCTDGSMVMRCTFPASCLSPWVYSNSKELTGNVGLCVCVYGYTHFKLGFCFFFSVLLLLL